MRIPTARPHPRGFTLLELVLGILLLGMLIGMVMTTANRSLVLANSVVKSQNEEMLHQAFVEFLNQYFTTLPGNTRFDVKVEDSGAQYLTHMTLQNVPMGFTWGGQERIAKAVQLSTVRRRSGYLDIVLSYYENEILDDTTTEAGKPRALSDEPFAQVILLENVRFFEWEFLDGSNLEWRYDWDLQGRLPLQVRLVFAFDANGPEISQVFWLPPKQNPEILFREMQQTRRSGGGGDPIVTPPPTNPE